MVVIPKMPWAKFCSRFIIVVLSDRQSHIPFNPYLTELSCVLSNKRPNVQIFLQVWRVDARGHKNRGIPRIYFENETLSCRQPTNSQIKFFIRIVNFVFWNPYFCSLIKYDTSFDAQCSEIIGRPTRYRLVLIKFNHTSSLIIKSI